MQITAVYTDRKLPATFIRGRREYATLNLYHFEPGEMSDLRVREREDFIELHKLWRNDTEGRLRRNDTNITGRLSICIDTS